MIGAQEQIKAWRQRLGLTRTEVAHAIGAQYSYYGIELHEGEIFETPLEQVNKLCQILQGSIWDLFSLICEFCSHKTAFSAEFLLPRNKLVRLRRLAKGWSTEELGDRIGFFTETVEEIEAAENYLDSWSFNLINELARLLGVPVHLLLSLKCGQCGR
jgi:transcriptional regulator with XRE-family HTH domain